MKKLATIGAAAVALISIPVAAQVAGQHRGPNAGPLTRASVQSMVEARFAKVDSNHDGFVTREEAEARMAAARDQRQARRGEMRERFAERGAERRGAMFDRLDANHDGAISRAEFEAAGAARAERRQARAGEPGTDGRGMGRSGEGRPGMRRARMMRMHRGGMMAGGFGPNMFERLDADHDGRVSLAEASSRALAMFDRADADRNGTVTPEERRAARERFREDRQGRDGRRGG